MKAFILTEGNESRLSSITHSAQNSSVSIGAHTVLERMLKQLGQLKVEEVILAVGYEADQIIKLVRSISQIPRVKFVFNHNCNYTGNAMSVLAAVKQLRGKSFLLIDGETILSDQAMQQLINTKGPALFYKDKSIFSKEELKLGIEGNRVILNKSLELSQSIGKYIGITKFDSQTSNVFFATLKVILQKKNTTSLSLSRCYLPHE